MTYKSKTEKEINFLRKKFPEGFDLSLTRISNLLRKLDNPHLKLPPIIHIAGTNGKGSTSAFCTSILEAHGFSVHLHTSPHLVEWRERFRIGSRPKNTLVDDAELAKIIRFVTEINGDDSITIFEILTAGAFLLFSKYPADFLVLEVGLGGRFDASNVIEQPCVSILTSVSFDHEAFLGNTLAKIAYEKAGIIKKGVPVVVACQPNKSVYDILDRYALKTFSKCYLYGRDYRIYFHETHFCFQDADGTEVFPYPGLLGIHQCFNAATAIAALKQIKFGLDPRKIGLGLKNVNWPGRMQKITHGFLRKFVSENNEIWLDGGHNADAAEKTAATLNQLNQKSPKSTILILGMLKTKNAENYLKAFHGIVDLILTVPLKGHQGYSEKDLQAISISFGYSAYTCPSLQKALQQAGLIDSKSRILISGSLYLVGEALSENGTLPN